MVMLDNLQLLFVWAPIINVQVILEGIFVGAVFALSAYGLALVWGVMNIKNLAQGDFVIMGGYLALALKRKRPSSSHSYYRHSLYVRLWMGCLCPYDKTDSRPRYVRVSACYFWPLALDATGDELGFWTRSSDD
jgi:ABC-type branched-subunit amino acid transport system permease subunit